jgi:hypothetical protein
MDVQVYVFLDSTQVITKCTASFPEHVHVSCGIGVWMGREADLRLVVVESFPVANIKLQLSISYSVTNESSTSDYECKE